VIKNLPLKSFLTKLGPSPGKGVTKWTAKQAPPGAKNENPNGDHTASAEVAQGHWTGGLQEKRND